MTPLLALAFPLVLHGVTIHLPDAPPDLSRCVSVTATLRYEAKAGRTPRHQAKGLRSLAAATRRAGGDTLALTRYGALEPSPGKFEGAIINGVGWLCHGAAP